MATQNDSANQPNGPAKPLQAARFTVVSPDATEAPEVPGVGAKPHGGSFLYDDKRWLITSNGQLFAAKTGDRYDLVCNTVPVIRRRIVDIVSRDERWEIAFASNGYIKTVMLSNSDFKSPQRIAEVAAKGGLRLTEGRYLLRWLLEYEMKNSIKVEESMVHCGWAPDGRFGLPSLNHLVNAQDDEDDEPCESTRVALVAVNPLQDDLLDFSAPFGPSAFGTLGRWLEAVVRCGANESPYGGILMGSMVSSIMLARLPNGLNSVDELVGDSKRGKTALSQAVQSFIGRPGKTGMERSWKDTEFGAKTSWAFLGCLPVIYEESTTAEEHHKNRITPKFVAYELPNALRRATGTKDMGSRQAGSWRLNAIVTGEAPILSPSQNAGAMNRVLTIGYTGHLGPKGAAYDEFGQLTSEKADFADRVKLAYSDPGITQAYGHGLLPLVALIQSLSDEELKKMIAEEEALCKTLLKGHSEAGHFASLAATKMVGLRLFHMVIEEERYALDGVDVWPLDAVRSCLCAALVVRDEDLSGTHGYQRAWKAFIQWALARRVTHFYTGGTWRGGRDQACLGVWEEDVGLASEEGDSGLLFVERRVLLDLHVTKEGLDRFVSDAKLPVDTSSMVRWWADQGYLKAQRSAGAFSQRFTRSVNRPGVILHAVYQIPARFFEEAQDSP